MARLSLLMITRSNNAHNCHCERSDAIPSGQRRIASPYRIASDSPAAAVKAVPSPTAAPTPAPQQQLGRSSASGADDRGDAARAFVPAGERKTTTRSRRDRRGECVAGVLQPYPRLQRHGLAYTRIDGPGIPHSKPIDIYYSRGPAIWRSRGSGANYLTAKGRHGGLPLRHPQEIVCNRTQWAVVSDVGANLRVCPPFEAASGRVLLNALRVAAPSPASQHDTRARSATFRTVVFAVMHPSR